jgi:hypothetical protein
VPFVKGNTIGAETRFKTGQSGNPAEAVHRIGCANASKPNWRRSRLPNPVKHAPSSNCLPRTLCPMHCAVIRRAGSC